MYLLSVQSKYYNSAALLLLLVWTCLIHLESAYVSVFILLRLEIGSALARTLSARLAASFVLDNTGHALLRLKQMRELVDVLVGRREGKRAASCHLLLPVLGGFLVRVKLGDVVIAFAGKTHEVLASMSKNTRALKRAALFSSLVRVQVDIDLLAGFRVNKTTLLLRLRKQREVRRRDNNQIHPREFFAPSP